MLLIHLHGIDTNTLMFLFVKSQLAGQFLFQISDFLCRNQKTTKENWTGHWSWEAKEGDPTSEKYGEIEEASYEKDADENIK